MNTLTMTLLKEGSVEPSETDLVKTEVEPQAAPVAQTESIDVGLKEGPVDNQDVQAVLADEALPAEPEPEPEPAAAEAAPSFKTMGKPDLIIYVEDQGAAITSKLPAGWKQQKIADLRQMVDDVVNGGKDHSVSTEMKGSTMTSAKEDKAAKTGQELAVLGHNSGDVVAPNPIIATAQHVENLNQLAAEEEFFEIVESTEFNTFRLGGVIAAMMTNGWTGEFDTFRDYCEQKLGIGYRKAMYFANIYTTLVELDVGWDKVKSIGWTKLREILPALTGENVDAWVEKAQAMTVLQLNAAVKASLAGDKSGSPDAPAVTSMSFKVHEDQKQTISAAIDKAKQILSTDVDTVALEHVCLDFANNADDEPEAKTAGAPADPVNWMQSVGWEKTLEFLEQAFPTLELTVNVGDDAA